MIEPIIVCIDQKTLDLYASAEGLIEVLSRAKSVRFALRERFVRPDDSASRAFSDIEIVAPLEGLVDKAAERAKLEKEAADLRRQAGSIVAKLANESFVSRAPAEVVEAAKVEARGDRIEDRGGRGAHGASLILPRRPRRVDCRGRRVLRSIIVKPSPRRTADGIDSIANSPASDKDISRARANGTSEDRHH